MALEPSTNAASRPPRLREPDQRAAMPERAVELPTFDVERDQASSEETGGERDDERFRRTAPTLTKSRPLLTGDPFGYSHAELC
jgi:hypothetical protein